MLGGVVEEAQGAPTHSALPFSTAYGSLAGPKLEDSDKVAMYTFCQILKRSRMTDDGPDLEAEKVLLNDFDWMMLSHWLTVLDKDPQSIAQLVKSQLVAMATEESRQTQDAPWGETFDALPLSGFGYGHPTMGNEDAWTAVEAQVLSQSQTPCATEGEGRVEGMVRCFLDIVINQHRLSHKFEFPHDPEASSMHNGYIRLECIAPWIKQHMLAHPSFSGPPPSPEAEATRLVVFTSLLLFFNHVLNFDGLWHRLRRVSEHWLVERQLQATSLRPLMLRQARSGDGMGGPMLLPDDSLERDEYILRTSAPPSPTAYPFQVVRLLQVALPPTPEQSCVSHHLKQLFFVGLNALLLDSSPSSPPLDGLSFSPHRMHQTLALLCHVAEERGLWGPFLIICPQAHMDAWANAAACLCPGLKTHLYRGSEDERAALRDKLQRLQPPCNYRGEGLAYTPRAPLHIVITSYRCMVEDTRHFTDATHPHLSEGVLQGLQWQYLIADHGLGLLSHPDARYAPFAACLLRIRARRRLLLAPTLHSTHDGSLCPLAPLLHFLLPSLTAALPLGSLSSLSPPEALRLRCLLYRLTCVYTGVGLMGPDHDVSTMASTVLPAPPPQHPPTATDPWLTDDLLRELQDLSVPERPDCGGGGAWRGWWQEQWGDVRTNADFPPFAELSDTALLGLPKPGTKWKVYDDRPQGVTLAYKSPWVPRLIAGQEEEEGEGRAHKPRHPARRPLKDQPEKEEEDSETSTDDEARARQRPPSPSKKRHRPWASATPSPHGPGPLLHHLEALMTPTPTTGPGLAKLWGQQFSSVLTSPTTVLGRLSRYSQVLGTRLGVGSGLGQGFLHVDVNLADAAGQSPAGPTTPLAPAHASIHWDPASRAFLLRCLSPLGLLLNDRPLHPKMGPVPLPSRSLLYIGGHLLCFTAPSPSTPPAGPRPLPPLFPDSRAVSLLLQLFYDLMTPKVGPNAILPPPTPHAGGGGSKRPRKSSDHPGNNNNGSGNGNGGNGRPSSRSDNSTTSSEPPSSSRKRPSSTPQGGSSTKARRPSFPLSPLSPSGHGTFLFTAPLSSPLSSLHPSAYQQSMAHAWKDLMARQHPHALPPNPLLLLQQQQQLQLQLQLQQQQHHILYPPAMLQAAAAATGLGSSLAPSPCHAAGSAGPSPSSLAMTIPLHMPPRLPPFTAQPSPSSASTNLDSSATRPTLP